MGPKQNPIDACTTLLYLLLCTMYERTMDPFAYTAAVENDLFVLGFLVSSMGVTEADVDRMPRYVVRSLRG